MAGSDKIGRPGRFEVKTRDINKLGVKWNRVCRKIMSDSVHVRVPRAFLPILTLFFHHVSDAMAGDDRPDHGLAKMRQGREHYQIPFHFIYGKLRRAEKRMSQSVLRKNLQLFHLYLELSNDREARFRERLTRGSLKRARRGFRRATAVAFPREIGLRETELNRI
jgi:hypothetical protein